MYNLKKYCEHRKKMPLRADKVLPYLDSQEFIDDCNGLKSLMLDDAERHRWTISLKWSENLVDMGSFPTQAESLAAAQFVIGETSLEIFIASLLVP